MKYLSERIRTKALSKKALKFELQQKGIDEEIIETSLSEFETDDSEVALRAARKKFGKYDIKEHKVEQKILSFLYHRGFSCEIGKSVVKIMKEE
jgi:regulatory protein